MTLEGPQQDKCDGCHWVAEVQPAFGKLLCADCKQETCPRCSHTGARWWPEYGIYVCGMCGDSFINHGGSVE